MFPRFDKFEDTFEGYSLNFIELVKKQMLEEHNFDASTIEFVMGIFSDSVAISNYFAYISCWHLNDFESAGMWKLYCSTDESLVIKTDVESLKKALQLSEESNVIFSKVTYDSKLKDRNINDLRDVNVFNALLMKRESFEHEKEYRILLTSDDERLTIVKKNLQNQELVLEKWKDEKTVKYMEEIKEKISNNQIEKEHLQRKKLVDDLFEQINLEYKYENDELKSILSKLSSERDGIKKINLDPEILIKEIIVSPYSPKWFVSTLQKLVLDLGYSFEVTQSELYNLK